MGELDKLIYVVDDELQIRELLTIYLTNSNYKVEQFESGDLALARFYEQECDMFILDVMLPGMNGYELCKKIREISHVPIIMISANDNEIDKVLGLELGSDDFLSKPFAPRELLARVHSVFRRSGTVKSNSDVIDTAVSQKASEKIEKSKVIKIADVVIIPDERRITKDGIDISFTTKEFSLIMFLAENKNKVFTREQIINNLWGYDYFGDGRSVDDLVKRIRKKRNEYNLDLDIKTVWGYGYKIID